MKAYDCPMHSVIDVLAGKWKLAILFNLKDGSLRFGELGRRISWCSEKVLAQQLRQMEADGLVSRRSYDESPPRVEYALTEHGHAARPALDRLLEWGERYAEASRAH